MCLGADIAEVYEYLVFISEEKGVRISVSSMDTLVACFISRFFFIPFLCILESSFTSNM